MNALIDTCGAAAAIGDNLSPQRFVMILIAGIVVGILAAEGLRRFLQAGDEQIAAAFRAAEDESLAIAEQQVAPYTGVREIPTQRTSNGEDLLRDFGSDR